MKKRKIHPTLSEDVIKWMDSVIDSLVNDGDYSNRHHDTHGKFIEVALQAMKDKKALQEEYLGRKL